jgi:hypothetical protein
MLWITIGASGDGFWVVDLAWRQIAPLRRLDLCQDEGFEFLVEDRNVELVAR